MEEESVTQLTKAKFEQLFKLTTDGEKLGSSLLIKPRLSGVFPDISDKGDNGSKSSERKQLNKKKREDKQGLINPSFEDDYSANKKCESCVIELASNDDLLNKKNKGLNENYEKDDVQTETEGQPVEITKKVLPKKIKKLKGKKSRDIGQISHLKTGAKEESAVGRSPVDDETKITSERREKRRRRKLDSQLPVETSGDQSSAKVAEQATENPVAQIDDNLEIVCVKIHRVDRLKFNIQIKHPLVRVHIVDIFTGCCLKKSAIGKLIDSKNDNVDYILPSLTQPFHLRQKRSFTPVWEEQLLFRESFEYLTKDSDSIIFFEILDFLPMATACSQFTKLRQESGWYHVAWGFLKVKGSNGILNVNQRLQLQLFLPPKHRIRPEPRIVPVYCWWKSLPKVLYPGTLFITLSSVQLPKDVKSINPTLSLDPIDTDAAVTRPDDAVDNLAIDAKSPLAISKSPVRWSRLPGQSCKVPNHAFKKLATVGKGCYTACFSRDGRLIACGCFQEDGSSLIFIYEVLTGKLLDRCQGQFGLIYGISFSFNDSLLVSASGDGSARIWKLVNDRVTTSHVLPHLSYVYCAQFHPLVNSVVVTGGFDQIVRIWFLDHTEDELEGNLVQELENHTGHVNTVCFDKEGRRLFSGDSCGIICVWSVINQERTKWELFCVIKNSELQGVTVNQLLIHPTYNQLIIQSRDSTIRVMDLESQAFILHLRGFLNLCEKIHCCVSPCGNYIFSGSEDRQVYVWNSISGDLVGIYSDLPFHNTVHCAIYHPFDHILAVASYGNNNPVVIYKYDIKAAQLGLHYVKSNMNQKPQIPQPSFDPSLTSTSLALYNSETKLHNLTEPESSTCLERIIKKLDSVMAISSVKPSSNESKDFSSWSAPLEKLGMHPRSVPIRQVVAKQDYSPQRSDELQFVTGDVIDILLTENDDWWIGRLSDGKQGYVPVNCVSKTKSIINLDEVEES